MATAIDDFGSWLDKKLKDLDIDENVFGSYITGILDGDETHEEKTDALEGILSEILTNDISQICVEIMDMWSKLRLPKLSEVTPSVSSKDVDIKLARLLESQSLQTPKQKQYTEEEKKIREAILSQYSQMTDDEDNGEEEASDVKENGLEKNRNVHLVMQAEKEKREQAKLDSQKKKEKDKEDREKQKQLREEKKEKRKTQKGERRR